MKYFFFSVFFLIGATLSAQTKSIDELFNLIKADKEDTNKVKHLTELGSKLKNINQDTSIVLSKQALLLSENLSTSPDSAIAHSGKRGRANSFGQLGVFYAMKADFPKALEFFLEALKADEELNNKIGVARHLGNIGGLYRNLADYEKALEYYSRVLQIAKGTENKEYLETITLCSIGNVYYSQKKYSVALDHYLRALEKAKALNNKQLQMNYLFNIGAVIKDQGDSAAAEGNAAFAMKYKYPPALEAYQEVLKMDEELGHKISIARDLGSIGTVYMSMGKHAEALPYFQRAISISYESGSLDHLKLWFLDLSLLYETSSSNLMDSSNTKTLNKEQMRLLALHYFKRYVVLRDEIFSEENKKQLVQKEMNFEFEKKEALAKAEQDKKDILTREELKRKESQRNYFIAGFVLVAFLALFILRGYREKRKANLLITEQKHLVEEKQKEILDSIKYARRIQSALITNSTYIEKQLKRLKN
jgi:two-component system, NtrC family, sensor kinase